MDNIGSGDTFRQQQAVGSIFFYLYAPSLVPTTENCYNVSLNSNDMILGVSGWVGEKMGFTEQQVRIAFVIGFFAFGVGIGLYFILWVVKMVSN